MCHRLLGIALCVALCGAGTVFGQAGVILTGQGAINRSMAGASTAAPIDASGALYWNPAGIIGLNRSEMEFGLEGLYPQTEVSSTVAAGALGPGTPSQTLSGATRAENSMFSLPSLGFVYLPDDPAWAFGLGLFSVGGFGVDYPASIDNPILAKPPYGVGQGSVYSNYQVLEIVPTAAYRVTDRLSVGFAPTLALSLLQLNPGLVGAPSIGPDGTVTYPALTNTRYAFGGGFQVGVYYSLDDGWALGSSFKSPQWLEAYRFHTTDASGNPVTDTFNGDVPMMVSAGFSYSGFERLLLACDVRYIDYQNTAGFRGSGFDPQGTLRGVGWDSIFAVAVGAQYCLTDALSLRLGYSYNEDPIPDNQALANVPSSAVEEHAVYLGVSYRLTDSFLFSLAYVHVFGNSIEGPLVTPQGPVAGTQIKDEVQGVDSLVVGLTVQFGAPR